MPRFESRRHDKESKTPLSRLARLENPTIYYLLAKLCKWLNCYQHFSQLDRPIRKYNSVQFHTGRSAEADERF